jgi:aryl-alcohol dehydrogenase-like predicted oxidoreductase
VVGLGCNNFGGRLDITGAREVVDAAVDSGITLLDTADVYGNLGGSEEFLGEVLRGRRDRVVLATKWGTHAHDMGYGPVAGGKGGRAYVRRALDESLRRLRTDHIDLYQLHTPDPTTPIAETIAAVSELVAEGKVRYVGHSNFAGWQIAEAAHAAREVGGVPFVSAQNHWSLLEREAEREVVPAAVRYGVGVLPYFPLANGLLTGKVRRGSAIPAGTRLAEWRHLVTGDRLDTVERLVEWGEKHGRSLLELAVGGLAARPGCTSVIAGATSAAQVAANAAAGEFVPTAEELAEIDSVLTGSGAARGNRRR